MVIFFPVILKQLFDLGRFYPWPKPEGCPRCGSHRLWGHGFVEAYFDGCEQPFLLKRYRCPICGCVMRLRPSGYFKRFQSSIATIRSSIEQKIKTGRWLSGLSRTRQCHWFRSLGKRIKAYLTDTWDLGAMAAFDYLLMRGQIPVSRAI
jgi:hypothetical protein